MSDWRKSSSMSAPIYVHPCTFYADLAIEGKVIIEIKAVKALSVANEAQLLNYLHISGCRLGYLVNFQGSRAVWKRFVV
ncbi:MAG: GxxExxY protein [Spirochaetales bacterium]|nr:GxxExxY protein [Spirochaetales bacterium]